jgi:hypothetical protein
VLISYSEIYTLDVSDDETKEDPDDVIDLTEARRKKDAKRREIVTNIFSDIRSKRQGSRPNLSFEDEELAK